MPKQHTVSVTWFDTCYSCYVLDMSGIVVGVERSGQTREELIDEVVDEIYAHDAFDARGDHVQALLRDAVILAVGERIDTWHLWPLDTHGCEIRDPDSEEIPEEQPSAWFRCELTSEPLRISLRDMDDDDGSVMVDCADGGAAGDDGYIDGSTWESLEDYTAYTVLINRKTLVEELTAEGYDVDCSEYSEPEPEDLKYWHAKCERERANHPDAAMLREIMGWTTLDDVRACRRVCEQLWRLDPSPYARPIASRWQGMSVPQREEHYIQACWDAGLPLNAEYLIRYERTSPV